MNILGIETSCDETSVAVVRDGRHILSNVVASQIPLHQKYGGVVPELASRQHVVTIIPVLEEAMKRANVDWVNVDAIAVTRGPGLSPALLVGVNAAKAISFARQKPLVAVNHMEGHIYSNWLIPESEVREGRSQAEPRFPAVCLIVSGGHTELVFMTGHGQYRLLGKTIDDAAGEAFDKAARILGLGYPGGPAIQRAAQGGDPTRFNFPRSWLKGTLDFSFSGLKTALLRKVEEYGVHASKPRPWQLTQETTSSAQHGEAKEVEHHAPLTVQIARITTPHLGSFTSEPLDEKLLLPKPVKVRVAGVSQPVTVEAQETTEEAELRVMPVADLAASFQAAVVDALVTKAAAAIAETGARELLVAGGVAANAMLRQQLSERIKVPFRYPPLILCTDNAAMIASAGFYRYADSRQYDYTMDIEPGARYV